MITDFIALQQGWALKFMIRRKRLKGDERSEAIENPAPYLKIKSSWEYLLNGEIQNPVPA